MPIIEHIDAKKPPAKKGGGPGKIPRHGGFGGGDDGGGEQPGDFVSTADLLRRYRLLLITVMISVATLFVATMIAYLLRGTGGAWDSRALSHRSSKPLPLPYAHLLINTGILVCSSFTLELARRSIRRKLDAGEMGIAPPRSWTELPWMGITVLLGLAFLAGQLMVWNLLRHQGIFFEGNIRGAFFYALTGLHAVHLLAGELALFYALWGNWGKSSFQSQRLTADTTAWYWHLMGVLWLGIFAVLHFMN